MTPRCEESVPLLGPALDGELAEEDLLWLNDHLASCPACRDRRALLAAQGEALRERLRDRAAGADLSRLPLAVQARIANERASASMGERFQVWATELWGAHRVAVAAGFAVAACVALAALLRPSLPSGPRSPMLAEASRPAAIDAIDFAYHGGAVLQSGGTTIIWVHDHEGVPQ